MRHWRWHQFQAPSVNGKAVAPGPGWSLQHARGLAACRGPVGAARSPSRPPLPVGTTAKLPKRRHGPAPVSSSSSAALRLGQPPATYVGAAFDRLSAGGLIDVTKIINSSLTCAAIKSSHAARGGHRATGRPAVNRSKLNVRTGMKCGLKASCMVGTYVRATYVDRPADRPRGAGRPCAHTIKS